VIPANEVSWSQIYDQFAILNALSAMAARLTDRCCDPTQVIVHRG